MWSSIQKLASNLKKLSRLPLFFLLSFVMFFVGWHMDSARAAGYQYYVPITVTSNTGIASGTNINFPMLVSSTFASWEPISDGGHIQNLTTASGNIQEPADLVFATSSANCATAPLNFETESYTSSTGALVDWVNVPSLSAGTVIYACYGNSSVTTDQSHPSSTWNPSFVAVYHMQAGSYSNGSTITDSTGNDLNLQINPGPLGAGGTISAVTGQVDGGLDLAGSGEYFGYVATSTSNSGLGVSNTTISGWVNFNSFFADDSGYNSLFGRSAAGYPNNNTDIVVTNAGTVEYAMFTGGGGGGGGASFTGASSVLATNTWYYFTGVYDGSDLNLYVNGSFVTSTAGAWDTSPDSPLSIGGDFTGDRVNNAQYDELEFSKTNRSPSWILTEYNNQNSPNTFYTMGGEVSAPGAPTGLTPTAGNTQVYLSWTAPINTGGSSITDYVVEYKQSSTSTWSIFPDGVSTSTTATVTGLMNGTSYNFEVAAVNAFGQGSASSVVTSTPATVPDAPVIGAATAGIAQATITFSAPDTDGGSPITSYIATSNPGGLTASSTSSPITVTGLTPGAMYTFTVAATNAVGTSASSSPSNSVTIPAVPGPPLNLAATVEEASIGLSWSAPTSNGGSPITDYVVEYELASGGSWSIFPDGTSTSTTATVTGLSDGTSYNFQVSAVNAVGSSTWSAIAMATPGEPAQVIIQSFSSLTIPDIGTDVRITNEGSAAYEYRYSWCVTATSTDPCGAEDNIFSATAAKLIQAGQNFDTTLTSTVPLAGNYWFTITALYGSASSSATDSFTAVATVPDPPTAVTATAGQQEATVAFSPPGNNGGSAITSYTVTSNPGNLTATGSASPITVTGLTGGATYSFTVIATNAIGTSSPSVASNFVAPTSPSTSSGGGGGGGGGISVTVPAAYGAPYVPTAATNSLAPVSSSSLQAELNTLIAELDALEAQAGQLYVFTRNLQIYDTGSDVTALQQFLITQNSGPAAQKLKAHGTSDFFGSLTYNALVEFQEKEGITPASGYFGPITRGYMNGLGK